MTRLRTAVIGVGHLGKEHARILAGLPEVELVGVADVNAELAQTIGKRVGTQAFSDYWPLLNLAQAACIVVPTCLHEPIAAEFLRRGIPVLVEKPLAPTLRESEALAELADKNGTLLQVGHIERFNPAYEEAKRRCLRPRFIRAERLGPFSGRSNDIGVVLDLMIHDLDLMLDLVGAPVTSVEALGVSIFGGHEDIANARLHFANGCVAELTASRAHPTPYRQMHLWGAEGYAGLDFAKKQVTLVQPSAEVRAHGLDPAKIDPASRARIKEELFGRHLETYTVKAKATDQLTCELKEFVNCVQSGARPRACGNTGRDAVALAERVLTSLRNHSWTGTALGPAGPSRLPPPAGPLFRPHVDQEVA
jgi:predicted dehydrogenase